MKTGIPVFPTTESQPHNINKTEGDDVSFLCKAHADPTPNITWSINGALLDGNIQSIGCLLFNRPSTFVVHWVSTQRERSFMSNAERERERERARSVRVPCMPFERLFAICRSSPFAMWRRQIPHLRVQQLL
jgi:hypothetical protein